jgi:hypothetical protein
VSELLRFRSVSLSTFIISSSADDAAGSPIGSYS